MPRWVLLAASVCLGYLLHPLLFPGTLNPEGLRGLRVLLTGASSGIGEQIAYIYARNGAHVFMAARREDRLKQVVEKCKTLGPPGGKYGYYRGDMGVAADRETFVQNGLQQLGGVDQLVLNHALMPLAQRWTGSREDVKKLEDFLQVNTVAFVDLTALTLPHLSRSGGSVGVVSSVAGRLPMPYCLEYSASKFGLDGFYGGLRQEWMAAKNNVSLTYVSLGMISTEQGNKNAEAFAEILLFKDAMLKSINFLFASPEGAAAAIIEATTRQVAEIIYPTYQGTWGIILLRHICPGLLDRIVAAGFA